MEKLNEVIFYTIDRAIRTYRQYAQKQLRKAGFNITIDQWLVIKSILESPGITQQELAASVFKDTASVTRIIELLVKANYLNRTVGNDRRRMNLMVTPAGEQIIKDVNAVVLENRETALKDINDTDIEAMRKVLLTIIKNCNA